MAIRAKLSAPREERSEWTWHHPKWTALSASLLMGGDRRMEAETYLAGGYGLRLAMESRKVGLANLGGIANVWQPSRLKGVLVSPEYGTPFLAATQVFDLRPTPRKYLSLDKVRDADSLFVKPGQILVTRSGNVGRSTIAHEPHKGIIISDDLLRIEPKRGEAWGWIYAYLRSPQARAMMSAAQYGHVIKHLEVSHLNALPIPMLRDELLADFRSRASSLMITRDRVYDLVNEAERLFERSIGDVKTAADPEIGFSVRASSIIGQRKRLEAAFHSPTSTAILNRFVENGLVVEPLTKVTERVWWMTRFKRVFGDGGMDYMSADELFAQNSPITKHVLVEQADNPEAYFAKAGWILMACSGQTYGLNGSVALMTKRHERAFFSHDLVRIIPRKDCIRPGYLFTAMGHPKLGRPLVIRYAYGTSIPHLEPADIATFPVVRLGEQRESEIADRMEEAMRLRAEADEIENQLASDAEAIIDRFIAGDMSDVVMVGA